MPDSIGAPDVDAAVLFVQRPLPLEDAWRSGLAVAHAAEAHARHLQPGATESDVVQIRSPPVATLCPGERILQVCDKAELDYNPPRRVAMTTWTCFNGHVNDESNSSCHILSCPYGKPLPGIEPAALFSWLVAIFRGPRVPDRRWPDVGRNGGHLRRRFHAWIAGNDPLARDGVRRLGGVLELAWTRTPRRQQRQLPDLS